MSDDPTQQHLLKVTITTESLVDGLSETTIFSKAAVQVSQAEATEALVLPQYGSRVTHEPPPPKILIEIQPYRDETTGIWVVSHAAAVITIPEEPTDGTAPSD